MSLAAFIWRRIFRCNGRRKEGAEKCVCKVCALGEFCKQEDSQRTLRGNDMSDLEVITKIREHLFHTLLVVDAHWLQLDPTVRQIVKEAHDTVLSEMLRLRKEESGGRI